MIKIKKKKKKFDRTKDPDYINLNKKIIKNTHKLWIPPIDPKFKCVNGNDTFFKILKYDNKEEFKEIALKKATSKKPKKLYKALKITIIFNNTQKLIINNWMNAYIKMYNETYITY